ncbi:hypothetical protein [Stenotrophomonas sp. NA06056]|uniref:hypothetical protein n=1 Tax=Stenotrophomonas sp. NA06056 TaxID=2742129 RepID=UPI0015887607|nr:hypothetical protein [Stenotrophomonas sp. NA06056]QKW55723.1 hypothetical protein HUT07_03510 [Stenotrophomonas sp. NA06056]
MKRSLLLFLLMLVSGSTAASVSVHIGGKPTELVTAQSAGMKVEVQLGIRATTADDPRHAVCEGARPCKGVQSLQIRVNGAALPVPRSAYFDLVDLSSAKIDLGPKGGSLMLQGGDASESYNVRIRFSKNRVLSREIFVGTSQDDLLEETTYHEVSIG